MNLSEKKRLTKVYPDGTVTLDASQFTVRQEVIDSNIRNSEPIKAAVERLKELEDRNEPMYPLNDGRKTLLGTEYTFFYCPRCRTPALNYCSMIMLNYCPECGQAIDWEGGKVK